MKVFNQTVKIINIELNVESEKESIVKLYEKIKAKELPFEATTDNKSVSFIILGYGDNSEGESEAIDPIIDEIDKLEKI